MKNRRIILYIFCTLLIASCAVDEQCRTNRTVLLGFGIYHVSYNDSTKLFTTTSESIDSITIKGLELDTLTGKYTYVDSILYNNTKAISAFYVPLHSFVTSSTFEITFNTKVIKSKNDTLKFFNTKDTLTVLHENINDYLSLECGCIKVHSIDTAIVTHNFIDSIKIINHTVNNVNAENIKIYK
ncbi:MAG: DUF6452 family protein [Paludibacter sp.]|nr:DUF6452 family protein [Paludibacter sp.]